MTWKKLSILIPYPVVAMPSLSSVVMTAVLGFLVFDRLGCSLPIPDPTPAPTPAPSSDAEAAGQAMRAPLLAAVGDALGNAAEAVRTGAALDKAKADCVAEFRSRSGAAFDAGAVPVLDKVLPPGETNPTPDQRAAYATALEALARGIKGG